MANDTEAKKGGTKPQIAIYQKIASREEEIIDRLFELMLSSNENCAVSAASKLLNKILADKRALEVSGVDGNPITIWGGAEYDAYLSRLRKNDATPKTGVSGSNEVQGASVAQESKENNDSNLPTG